MDFDRSKITILIVDDTPENVSILGEFLSGYRVKVALDGTKALHMLSDGLRPTLILLDIMMPGIDGYEVCRRIKANPDTKDIPVIFITALSDLADKVKGFEYGAVDYITKPFHLAEVNSRINTHLGLTIYRKELEKSNEVLEEKVKERTRELELAKEKAEEANMVKSHFLSLFSHEMRTPLAGIMGFSEALIDGVEGNEKQQYIKYLYDSAQRLKGTIESILTLKNLESETKQLVPVDFDVNSRVNTLLKGHSEYAARKGLTFEATSLLTENSAVLDRGMFDVIVDNIVSNAVKYTEAGSVKVTLREEVIDSQRYICFVVKDTGPGIPQEKHAVIFEEFRQVHEGMRRNFEGVGLGLSLVRKYIDACGGMIELESITGKGSVFTIKLPVQKLSEVKPASPLEQPPVHLPPGKPRILVVEDDRVNAEVAEYYLRKKFEVYFAADGEAALRVANENKFPVILMDINLGKGMSGVDVTKELRKRDAYKDIPIVACTAFAMESDRVSFLEAGCTHYLAKPYKRQELFDVLQNACPWLSVQPG